MELSQASGMQRYVALFGYLHNDLGQAMRMQKVPPSQALGIRE